MVTRLSNEEFQVMNESKVTVTTQGNITNVKHLTFKNEECPIEKIDADHYRIKKTGEVREYVHIENRSQSLNSLRQTFSRLRELINSNVSNPNKCLWVTLTYRQDNGEPMTDPDKLMDDFKKFQEKLRRSYCPSHNIGKPEYISVVEPQGSGAWHCHVILIFPTTHHYIPNEDIARMWGQGFTSTKALKSQFGNDVDNVGAYLTAYLGDIPLDEVLAKSGLTSQDEVKTAYVFNEKLNKMEEKHFVKGARLKYYPRHFKLYRHSRGIFEPIKEEMTFLEAKKKARGQALTYSSHNLVELKNNGSTTLRNVVSNYYFNSVRENTQVIYEHDLVDSDTGTIIERNWL